MGAPPEETIQEHPELNLAVCIAKTVQNMCVATHARQIELHRFISHLQAQTEQEVMNQPQDHRQEKAEEKNERSEKINKSLIQSLAAMTAGFSQAFSATDVYVTFRDYWVSLQAAVAAHTHYHQMGTPLDVPTQTQEFGNKEVINLKEFLNSDTFKKILQCNNQTAPSDGTDLYDKFLPENIRQELDLIEKACGNTDVSVRKKKIYEWVCIQFEVRRRTL